MSLALGTTNVHISRRCDDQAAVSARRFAEPEGDRGEHQQQQGEPMSQRMYRGRKAAEAGQAPLRIHDQITVGVDAARRRQSGLSETARSALRAGLEGNMRPTMAARAGP